MALNFPSNPSENDIYQFGLLTYIFKNGKWVSQSRGASQLPWYSNMEQARALWKRLAAEAGLNLVDGSFEEGAEVASSSDVVWWQAGSAIYGWHLNEAKTVPAGSTPETTGGIGAGAWVDRTDLTLRSEISDTGGAGLIGTSGGGTVQSEIEVPFTLSNSWLNPYGDFKVRRNGSLVTINGQINDGNKGDAGWLYTEVAVLNECRPNSTQYIAVNGVTTTGESKPLIAKLLPSGSLQVYGLNWHNIIIICFCGMYVTTNNQFA